MMNIEAIIAIPVMITIGLFLSGYWGYHVGLHGINVLLARQHRREVQFDVAIGRDGHDRADIQRAVVGEDERDERIGRWRVLDALRDRD